MASFPEIKSKHSLVAKHVTKEKWDKLKDITTKTCGFTLAQVYCLNYNIISLLHHCKSFKRRN